MGTAPAVLRASAPRQRPSDERTNAWQNCAGLFPPLTIGGCIGRDALLEVAENKELPHGIQASITPHAHPFGHMAVCGPIPAHRGESHLHRDSYRNHRG